MYKVNKYLRNTLQKIRKDHPESYQDIEDFVEDLLAEGKSVYRMYSYAIWLNKILKVVNKLINEWNKRDVRRVIKLHCRIQSGKKLPRLQLKRSKRH